MKASDFIIDFLARQGVTRAFEMSGGMIAHLLDSVARQNRLKLVSMHHEQGAAFAVDGFGRTTGLPGVALATSGPGATNLLTGIGSCHFDSTPGLFITGQVNLHEQKGSRAIRQLGFQETDIVSMARPITKAAYGIRSVEELMELLPRAFHEAIDGRPGPVLLDIPMDIQRQAVPDDYQPMVLPRATTCPIAESTFERLWSDLRKARRPLAILGGGVRSGLAQPAVRALLEALGLPAVHSLMAVDALPAGHPLRVGLLGSYGNRWTNLAVGESDFLLVLGSRLDIRQTGNDTESFRRGRIIHQVDVDAGEMNNRVTGCHAIHAHIADFATQFLAWLDGERLEASPGWHATIAGLRSRWPDVAEIADVPGINPNTFMHQLSAAAASCDAFVVDVGQHQMWAAQSLDLLPHQRFLTSGGMGSMGFALPAAIGVAASPGHPRPLVIAGDGGFQANIQELQTVHRNGFPIKMVVINNRCHGMVRQFQESYFDGRYQSTYWGYSAPDFTEVARAYRIVAARISEPAEVEAALATLFEDPGAPALLEVQVDLQANAYPKIAFGKPMTEMEPLSKPIEMEST